MALVLVVDDDARIRRLLQSVLGANRFDILVADDGAPVAAMVRTYRPDALVLDLNMPQVSGFTALRTLRAAGEDLPVLVLTAFADEANILDAFDAGADDYVVKPFQPRVLIARLRAMLRRHQLVAVAEASPSRSEMVSEVVLDGRTRHARIGKQEVSLTPTEYQLLRVLMQDPGHVFSAAELLASVWGPAYIGEDDIIRANIYRLRHKLEPQPRQPRYIQGRRGVGYYFSP